MEIAGHPLGVCSWSLRTKGTAQLAEAVRELDLQHVQLALGELIQLDDKRKSQELSHLQAAGIKLTAGMIAFPGEDYTTIQTIRQTGGFVPDDLWPIRRALAAESARFASAELGIKMVSTHIGFVPPPSDAGYQKIVERTKTVAADFAARGVDLLMETGPESAEEMRAFISDVGAPNLFVNFDPANMILYGAGDPIQALNILSPHIRHVHLKDAIVSAKPGIEWGSEVPFGSGQIGAQRFLGTLKQLGYSGPLVIEREAGDDRMADVRQAIAVCHGAGVRSIKSDSGDEPAPSPVPRERAGGSDGSQVH
jgi:L-ribulose-5-phosphate 3-epimerase